MTDREFKEKLANALASGTKTTWVRYEVNKDYLKRLTKYYNLSWRKRLFRRVPR